MTEINNVNAMNKPAMVEYLKSKTRASTYLCKKALTVTNYNLEKSIEYIGNIFQQSKK
jgi:translation elongation factor EF-Ts